METETRFTKECKNPLVTIIIYEVITPQTHVKHYGQATQVQRLFPLSCLVGYACICFIYYRILCVPMNLCATTLVAKDQRVILLSQLHFLISCNLSQLYFIRNRIGILGRW